MTFNNGEPTEGINGEPNKKETGKDVLKKISCEEQRKLCIPFRTWTDEELRICIKHYVECPHCGVNSHAGKDDVTPKGNNEVGKDKK